MKTIRHPLPLLAASFILAGCEPAGEEQSQRIQQLADHMQELAKSLDQLKQQQAALLSAVDESEQRRKGLEEAWERNQKTVLTQLGEISNTNAGLAAQFSEFLERSQQEPEEFEVLTIELDKVGSEISERIKRIQAKRQTLTAEQDKQVSMLKRRQRDLSLILYPLPSRGFPQERREEDLSDDERKKVDELRKEIKQLEDEAGHLLPPPSNSSEGVDAVRKYLAKKYQGSRAILFNKGFGSSRERILHMPEGMRIIDITPDIMLEIERMEDGDDFFRTE